MMNKTELMNAIRELATSADIDQEVASAIIDYTEKELVKLQNNLEKNADRVAARLIADRPLVDAMIDYLDDGQPRTAAEIAAAVDVSTSKAVSLTKTAASFGYIINVERVREHGRERNVYSYGGAAETAESSDDSAAQ